MFSSGLPGSSSSSSSSSNTRWSILRARDDTIVRGLPRDEHVTDLYNVAVSKHAVHVHIHPTDHESLARAREFNGSLPAQALARRELPGGVPRLIVHTSPLHCATWDSASLFFLQPYHIGNLCHLMNEAVLPLMLLALGVERTDCEVYMYRAAFPPAFSKKSLPHFGSALNATCARVGQAESFWLSPRRCVSRLTWGLGVKPIFSSFRVASFRKAVSELRSRMMMSRRRLPGSPLWPVSQEPPALTITLRRLNGGWRSIRDYSLLEERFRIDAHCCDFQTPLSAQLELLESASVVIGLHGAGLTNILFVRDRPVLIELKPTYGLAAFEYRKYTQSVSGGYAAVHVPTRAASKAVDQWAELTHDIALVVHECIAALQTGSTSRCSTLPHVMQVLPIGASEDCFFREWLPLGRSAGPGERLCPTPSWIEPMVVHGQRACYHVHAHAALSPPPLLPPLPPPSSPPLPSPPLLHSPALQRRRQQRQQRHSTTWAKRQQQQQLTSVCRQPQQFELLEDALHACKRFVWCAGVSNSLTHAERARATNKQVARPRGKRQCAPKMYELRALPLVAYMGVYSGQDSWVALNDEKACEVPSPELAGKGATLAEPSAERERREHAQELEQRPAVLGRVYRAALSPAVLDKRTRPAEPIPSPPRPARDTSVGSTVRAPRRKSFWWASPRAP